MLDAIDELLDGFKGNEGASTASLTSLEREMGVRLPSDYRTFMARYNGGEGPVGRQYLILWRAEEIVPFNRDYEVNEYAPGLMLFASSGGGEAFAFDMRSNLLPIVQVPFVGLDVRYAQQVASHFTELLKKMSVSHGSLI